MKYQGPLTEDFSAECRRIWIPKNNIKDWTPTRNLFVCSVHFFSSEVDINL